jgi:hypothetical protein
MTDVMCRMPGCSATERSMPSHPSRIFVRDLSYFRDRAKGLIAVVADGLPNGIEQVRRWHPSYQDASDAAIQSAAFSLEDAQLVYARQHGYESWPALARYLRTLPATADSEPFLTVFEAAQRGDWARAADLAHDSLLRRGTAFSTVVPLHFEKRAGMLLRAHLHRYSPSHSSVVGMTTPEETFAEVRATASQGRVARTCYP